VPLPLANFASFFAESSVSPFAVFPISAPLVPARLRVTTWHSVPQSTVLQPELTCLVLSGGIAANKLGEKLDRIGAERPDDYDKFDQVDPAFAGFILGDKRLRAPKLCGERLLPDTRTLPRCDKGRDKPGRIPAI
jgi:hypothetical protein